MSWRLVVGAVCVTLLLVLIGSQAFAQEGTVIFTDDFSQDTNQWELEAEEGGKSSIAGGQLLVTDSTDDGTATAAFIDMVLADGDLTVESQLVDGTPSNWHQITCRRDENSAGYQFAYSPEGWIAGALYVEDVQVWRHAPERSDVVKQGKDVVNIMRLSCIGSQIRFWLNGVLLIELEDDRLIEGQFGVMADSYSETEGATVAFDNAVLSIPTTPEPVVKIPGGIRKTPAAAVPLLEDDFSDPASGWETGAYEGGQLRYVKGEYAVKATKSGVVMWGVAGLSVTDVTVTVDARVVDGPANNNVGYGVKCRSHNTNSGKENAYLLAISGDGFYGISKAEEGTYTSLVDWTASDAILQGSGTNQLEVVCDGSHLALSVNGVLLAEVQDKEYISGDIGLAAVSFETEQAIVHFDNVRVLGASAPEPGEVPEPAVQSSTGSAPATLTQATVTAASLNVRSGPGANYPRVGVVNSGDVLDVRGRNTACSWVMVETSGGTGWVSASYVKLTDSCSNLPVMSAGEPAAVATAAPTAGSSAGSGTNLISGFESFGTWVRGDEAYGTFTQSGEQVYDGKWSGKLAYNFPAKTAGGRNYVVFRRSIPINGKPVALNARIYGDNSESFLNVWVQDATGQLWQFSFGQIKHTGWKVMTAPLDPSLEWPVQPIDGSATELVYPLTFYALVLDYPTNRAASGAIYIDLLRAVQP